MPPLHAHFAEKRVPEDPTPRGVCGVKRVELNQRPVAVCEESFFERLWNAAKAVPRPMPNSRAICGHEAPEARRAAILSGIGAECVPSCSTRCGTRSTRLRESGCDARTLARIAGHSSVAVSARYVHPSDDKVLEAISRLGEHNSGHIGETPIPVVAGQLPASNVELSH